MIKYFFMKKSNKNIKYKEEDNKNIIKLIMSILFFLVTLIIKLSINNNINNLYLLTPIKSERVLKLKSGSNDKFIMISKQKGEYKLRLSKINRKDIINDKYLIHIENRMLYYKIDGKRIDIVQRSNTERAEGAYLENKDRRVMFLKRDKINHHSFSKPIKKEHLDKSGVNKLLKGFETTVPFLRSNTKLVTEEERETKRLNSSEENDTILEKDQVAESEDKHIQSVKPQTETRRTEATYGTTEYSIPPPTDFIPQSKELPPWEYRNPNMGIKEYGIQNPPFFQPPAAFEESNYSYLKDPSEYMYPPIAKYRRRQLISPDENNEQLRPKKIQLKKKIRDETKYKDSNKFSIDSDYTFVDLASDTEMAEFLIKGVFINPISSNTFQLSNMSFSTRNINTDILRVPVCLTKVNKDFIFTPCTKSPNQLFEVKVCEDVSQSLQIEENSSSISSERENKQKPETHRLKKKSTNKGSAKKTVISSHSANKKRKIRNNDLTDSEVKIINEMKLLNESSNEGFSSPIKSDSPMSIEVEDEKKKNKPLIMPTVTVRKKKESPWMDYETAEEDKLRKTSSLNLKIPVGLRDKLNAFGELSNPFVESGDPFQAMLSKLNTSFSDPNIKKVGV